MSLNSWHPATKLTVVSGGAAIVGLLMFGEDERTSTAVAALPHIDNHSSVAKANDAPVKPMAQTIPSRDELRAMVERPLFTPTRRPRVDEPAKVFEKLEDDDTQALPVITPEPEMTFVGSLVRDKTVLALVTRGYFGRVESVGVGEEIDGWKVLEIGDRAIELGLEDRRLEFRIFD